MQLPLAQPLSARQEGDLLTTLRGTLAYTAITFSRVSDTYDPETGIATGEATTTVVGQATEVDGHPTRYEELGLVASKARTLLFVPDTEAEEPELGSSCTWSSDAYTVKGVFPIALTGSDIASIAEVVISR